MKYKIIEKEYFSVIIDRLTRFESANVRYERVFNDIINKYLIADPINPIARENKALVAIDIINNTLLKENDFELNQKIAQILLELEKKYFYKNEDSYQYLSNRINYCAMADMIDVTKTTPKNVIWFKKLVENLKNDDVLDIYELRNKYSLLYPIEKIILCEGQTEFTLIETIFKLFNFDINKLGFYLLAAGGKNQVAKKFYKMVEYTKIPFFILLDRDGINVKEAIEAKLRDIDKLYLLNCGEFEDLIPKDILLKTINNSHKNDYNCNIDDFNDSLSMVSNLENIYKKYGFGEFKKAKFALNLKQTIENDLSRNNFLNSEIVDIINILK